jgi:hypothetical protein
MVFMLSGRSKSLKPQDILILIKIVCLDERPFRIIDLSLELNISPGEITMGLERLRLCGLLASDKRRPNKASILEFLVHGLKYVFPAELGPVQRGVETCYSAANLSQKIISDTLFVWPSMEGKSKGTAVSPLYDSVAFAALKDPKLHRLMALIDTIRIGRVREHVMAIEELKKEFSK